MNNFNELIERARMIKGKKIAVACAHESHVLISVENSRKDGIADAILIGNKEEIIRLARELNIDLANYEVIDEKDSIEACRIAVRAVIEGKAHMLMKGLVDTSVILKAVLNKEEGLRPKGKDKVMISHVAAFDVDGFDRIMLMSDAAMNIAPNLEQKVQIIENTVSIAYKLGISIPKVAVLAAKEKEDPKMPVTIEAAELQRMNEQGTIKGCVIQGPLALDNAVSMESVKIKGLKGEVAGQADILITPDIEAGNILYKSLTYFAKAKTAGVIAGATAPIILTSRADSEETKHYSIALATLL